MSTTVQPTATSDARAQIDEPTLNPEVTHALAHLEADKQAARDAGLWTPDYERVANTLAELFIEQNDVDSVLEAIFQAMANQIAAEHNLRMVRANESADEQMGGEIVVWRDSGLVILPHSMKAVDVLDQLRAALVEKADA
jgi:ATP-dependent DNA ligase